MYTLKQSDGSHAIIGESNGNRIDGTDGTFWVTGWSDSTRAAVSVGLFYLLNSSSVEVKEIGGAGQGGIRFELTG